MTTKEYLYRIGNIDTRIKNKKNECVRLKEIAYSMTAVSENMGRTSSNPQRMATAVEKYVDIEREEIEKLIAERKQGIEIIEKLPGLYYQVIYKRYIEKKDNKTIAAECDRSKSRISEIHKEAITMIDEIMKGM